MTPPDAIGAYDRDREPRLPTAERPVRPGGWVDEAPPSEGLLLYSSVVRARLHLVALAVAVAVLAAMFLLARAEKVYEAEAGLLITPISRNNTTLFGLGLVAETGDPTRDAETISQLITTPAVAERVRRDLKAPQSATKLLGAVKAQPVAQSSIVAVTAQWGDPAFAARLADAFGEAAIKVRTERMRARLDDTIPRLRALLRDLPRSEVRARESLSGRLRDLEALRPLSDPTLHFETHAAVPRSPVSPKPMLTMVAAVIAGLVLGISLVLVAHVLSTRVEREEELKRYHVPILGRIPQEPLWRRITQRGPLTPTRLSRPSAEAVGRLASSLVASTQTDEPTLFVTSAGARDGKTTVALNLAHRIAGLAETVVLVDADFKRPSLTRVLAVTPTHGLTDVVAGRVSLAEALGSPGRAPFGLRGVLVQKPGDEAASIPIPPEAADRLVHEARKRAKWLVVDGPALSYAPDALPLAKRASGVLVVVRLGVTRARDLAYLADLLARQGITPDGFVVIGGGRPRT